MLVLESVQGMEILGRESNYFIKGIIIPPSLWHDLYLPSGGAVRGQVGQVIDKINSRFGYLGTASTQ